MKRISSTAFWVAVFTVIVGIQVYSALGQTADIAGSWTNGNVGAIQYQDRVTGSTKPGRGSVFSYKFQPNGTYEYVGYMEVSMYNCTTTLFNQNTGKYTVEGSTMTLDANRDFWKSTNSCAASGNKQQTKPPVKKTVSFRRTTNEYNQEMLCIDEGKGETCYRQEKE